MISAQLTNSFVAETSVIVEGQNNKSHVCCMHIVYMHACKVHHLLGIIKAYIRDKSVQPCILTVNGIFLK